MDNKVLVVGAGLGGLATALRLAKKGYKVEIIEKSFQPGGRLNQLKKDGFTFDTGPSFFSMSYEFTDFAKECNINLPFKYFELDPLYTVNFSNNPETFHLYKDLKKLAVQFKDTEPDFEAKMERYLNRSGRLFNDTVDLVIRNNFDSLFDYFITLMKVNPIHIPILFNSFWKEIKKKFSSKEAREIVSLVAFFLGRTPFDTMAIYTLLSYTEFRHDGYYNVDGGMYRIVEGIAAELARENVKITCDTEITDFNADGKRLNYLIDSENKKWYADIFLINADAAYFRCKVFRRRSYSIKKLERMEWTMGYLTFYVGVKCKLPQVEHHNYYLGNNYEEYANAVLKNPGTVQNPYYYVNVLSKHNPQCAPEGCESLFFVCPVPNLQYKTDWSDKEKIVDSIIADFSVRIDKDISNLIVSRTIYTPIDWQNQYNLYKGSGLGLAHNMRQIGALRPHNYDEKFRNVFYAGASTVPGAGLPMSIISSKLACERIVRYTAKNNHK